MAEYFVGTVADFSDNRRKILKIDSREVFVLRYADKFFAYENTCLHMGGPVGEGVLIARVEAVLGPDMTYEGERFSDSEMHIVCPWHGFEYDLETGAFCGNRKRRLRKYEVEQRGDDVYIID